MMFTVSCSCRTLASIALLSCAALLGACSDGSDAVAPGPAPGPTYSADIVWTEFGVPHVSADDYGSLGYGAGYVYARENYCTVMRAYVAANGESARYFGSAGNLNEDLVMKLYNSDAAIARIIDEDLPDYIVDNLTGYAAGVNRYFNETGAANLAQGEEGCRDAPWVREVDLFDVVRLIHRTVLVGSASPLANFIVAANPELEMAQVSVPPGMTGEQMLVASLSQEAFDEGMGLPEVGALGSNAYAIGADASQSSAGLLFGNPHFPWQGQQRFFMFHLTLGDEYDVMGAALGGLPAPVIGFNRDVAWSHTVSTGDRFGFYELTLNPQNKLQYLYDGQYRDLEPRTVSTQRLNEDGSLETIEHTFYLSHFGPVVDLGALEDLLAGWPNVAGTVLAYRDANLENLRGLDQWVTMGKAKNLDEFKSALRSLGIPWVNTIAADRYGDAFYGDISVVPNVPASLAANCVRGLLQNAVTGFGFLTMDGSDPACEWESDEGVVDGIFGYDSLPKLETRAYGANANDSYWLSNPRQLLTGFPSIIGAEEIEQSVRTRHTFSQAERRIAGTDGLGEPGFNIDNLRTLSYQATNHAAALVLDAVLEVCQDPFPGQPADPLPVFLAACEVLENWDGSHRIDSTGGHVFYEFWRELRGRALDALWSVPFDPADPVNTPRDLNIADTDVRNAVADAITLAAITLQDAGIALDAPWGEVQFDERNGVRIPIHGGSGSMMFSVITSNLVDGQGYADIRHGNSYMQAVTWDESDCPQAFNIITYSQSTDPASPHYSDMTELYSSSGWIDAAFCVADVEAAQINRMSISQ